LLDFPEDGLVGRALISARGSGCTVCTGLLRLVWGTLETATHSERIIDIAIDSL
jgi:hypothetical protein